MPYNNTKQYHYHFYVESLLTKLSQNEYDAHNYRIHCVTCIVGGFNNRVNKCKLLTVQIKYSTCLQPPKS